MHVSYRAVDAVWEGDNQRWLADPLALAITGECIEYGLRRVREVAVLRLPDRKLVRAVVRVTRFEAEDTWQQKTAVIVNIKINNQVYYFYL